MSVVSNTTALNFTAMTIINDQLKVEKHPITIDGATRTKSSSLAIIFEFELNKLIINKLVIKSTIHGDSKFKTLFYN